MSIYQYQDIRQVHLELSSLCNAECPFCPRNLFGYPYNDGYTEKNLTLKEVKHIFQPEFLQQLKEILINGNFGDFVMNPESLDIIEYFQLHNPALLVTISTNGGARNADFWRKLADYNTQIHFCIEGLEDTHHLYRKNTLFSTVINNAKTYINAGGRAFWKMLIFDHNRHQIDQCRQLSNELGFKNFDSQNTGRNSGPVFNKDGNFLYSIGNNTFGNDIQPLLDLKKHHVNELRNVVAEVKPISCRVSKDKSIYISSTGEVYPCCFLGFQPTTFGHGNWVETANKQVAKLVKENSALEYSIEHCMQWFNSVADSWNISDFEQGRLLHCNDICGQCN